MIPADRPYVGLLVIKYFLLICFLDGAKRLQRQRPKTRNIGHIYQWSDAVHRMLKPRNTRDFNGALDTRKLCLPGDKQLAPSLMRKCRTIVNVVMPSIIGRACALE